MPVQRAYSSARGFPDHGHLDLARILELLLDLPRYLMRQDGCGIVVPIAPGATITRISRPACIAYTLSTPLWRVAMLLEVAQTLDVLLERLAARARPRPGQRVGGLHDHGFDRLRLRPRCGGPPSRGRRLRTHRAAGHLAAHERVRALDFVGDALPMSCSSAARRAVRRSRPAPSPSSRREGTTSSDGPEDVLPVAGSEAAGGRGVLELLGIRPCSRLEHGLLAGIPHDWFSSSAFDW